MRADQFLAEGMVARQAAKKGKSLSGKFWQDPQYERDYMVQLRLAMGLLNKFSFEAILNSLRSKEGKTTYSFGAKWLLPLFEREQERLNNQQKLADAAASSPAQPHEPMPEPSEPAPTFRKPTKKTSSLDKLDDI